MNHKALALGVAAALLLALTSCGSPTAPDTADDESGARILALSDSGITLDGVSLSPGQEGDVTVSHDIVYYRDGTDDSYGEGSEADMHSAEEAAAHTVVTIRKAGTYRVSGKLSAGQLSVDLGENAKRDPTAVVTLILDGVDITCTVAPAVIFYSVYECDTAWAAYDGGEAENYALAPSDVDLSSAGANVVLADGSVNNVSGSYVARIYKEGTTKKLHKYDGAFYSKMSMNVGGSGTLNITAENEGLDSELHLAVNGGTISIQAQNDGINTNEDGVSVTIINGGTLTINAGLGEEGDGIDSNGHIVINGGTVLSTASDHSPDGGLDADGKILINGGSVTALGIRNDAVSAASQQLYIELSFQRSLSAGAVVELSQPDGTALLSFTLEKSAQSVILSAPELEQDVDYILTVNSVIQQYTGHTSGGFAGMGGPGNKPPEGESPPEDELPESGFQPPDENVQPPEPPEDSAQPPEDWNSAGGQQPPQQIPNDQEPPNMPDGQQPEGSFQPGNGESGEPSSAFTLTGTVRAFSSITNRQ